jgi:phage FluMu protein Com
MKIDYKNIKCLKCGKILEIVSSKEDGSYFQGLCRNCLCYWDIKRIDCDEEDIMELASE